MSNKYPSNQEFKWCESWRSLLLVCNIITIILVLVNLFIKIRLHYTPSGAQAWLYIALAASHVGMLAFFVFYIQNYRFLVKKKTIQHSKALFLKGLIPLVLYHAVTIMILIFA